MILVSLEQLLVSIFGPVLLLVVVWAGPAALALAYLQRNALPAAARPLWTLVALVPVVGPLAVLFSTWPRKANSA